MILRINSKPLSSSGFAEQFENNRIKVLEYKEKHKHLKARKSDVLRVKVLRDLEDKRLAESLGIDIKECI